MLIKSLISHSIVRMEFALHNAVKMMNDALKLNKETRGRKHLLLWDQVFSTNKRISVNMIVFDTKINRSQQIVLLFGAQVH